MYKRNHGILCGEQVSLEIRTQHYGCCVVLRMNDEILFIHSFPMYLFLCHGI